MKKNDNGSSIILYVAVSIVVITVLTAVLLPVFSMFFVLREAGRALDEGRCLSMKHDPNKYTDFFLIMEHIHEHSRNERFVVANAPVDTAEILERIAEFNQKSITVDMIKAQTFVRSFYRETLWITRNFTEGEPYPMGTQPGLFIRDNIQEISNHHNDLSLNATYSLARNAISARMRYRFRTGEIFERHIPNIHSYFSDSDGNLPENIPTIEFERRQQ